MRHAISALAVAPALGMLAACATHTPGHDSNDKLAARYAHYAAYAGPPISQFTWLGHFDSWEELGKDKLVVFTTPSDAYLLTVWPNCDLRFVSLRRGERIGVTSTSGTVSSGLDSVIENSSAIGPQRCPISEIRKVDYRRMRADERARAQANKEANAVSSENEEHR